MQRTTPAAPQRMSNSSSSQVVRSQVPRLAVRTGQPPAPISASHSSINIRYLEKSPIRVRGLVTGLHYDFSDLHPIQAVDARDAASLLNTRFFRRA
jgi:hypothetical protein